MSLYTELEDEVITDIARRVKKTGRYTETAELMAKSMREQGFSSAKIQTEVMKLLRADTEYKRTVAENTRAYKQMVTNMIRDIVHAAKKAGNKLIAEAGMMAWNNDLSMWSQQGVDLKKPNTLSQLMEAFARQTNKELRNLTKSMGFKNTGHAAVKIMNAYQHELDLAVLKVSTGTFSFDQAVNDCIKRLAQSGLRTIDYASGKTYQIDTVVRMAVRTGASQLSGKIMEKNLENTGQDLVITSQHMGSRPEHAPWQNKVFSYSGKSKKYPAFFDETGYGTVTGLKGANCTHDFYPFWEGISVIPEDIKEPDPVVIDGKEYTYYEATQKQRRMERNIRALKREINATESLGMDSKELRSKTAQMTAEYRKFSDKAGMKPKENRLRIIEGASNLQETKAFKEKVKINESRARKEKANLLFDIETVEKGDVVQAISLFNDLRTSDVGRHVLEFIEKKRVSVDILYNNNSIEEAGMKGEYGRCIGDHIFINARNCKTKKKMVETIIHEETHIELNIGGDRHAECVCDCRAELHRKGQLTADDFRSIIKSVAERYPEMKWRRKDG